MTPKEELIQAIQRSSDEIVQQLLAMLKTLEHQQSLDESQPAPPNRTYRKQGVLVIDAGDFSGFNGSNGVEVGGAGEGSTEAVGAVGR